MRELLTTLLELLGLAAIVGGIGFIYWPAALIAAGLGLLWVAREVNRS